MCWIILQQSILRPTELNGHTPKMQHPRALILDYIDGNHLKNRVMSSLMVKKCDGNGQEIQPGSGYPQWWSLMANCNLDQQSTLVILIQLSIEWYTIYMFLFRKMLLNLPPAISLQWYCRWQIQEHFSELRTYDKKLTLNMFLRSVINTHVHISIYRNK